MKESKDGRGGGSLKIVKVERQRNNKDEDRQRRGDAARRR